MHFSKSIVLLLLMVWLDSCTNNRDAVPALSFKSNKSISDTRKVLREQQQNGIVRADDYVFFSDCVLKGHESVLKYYFSRYSADTCAAIYYKKTFLINNFAGLLLVADLNNNGVADSVFVLNELNYCRFEGDKYSGGQAYYFTDTSLPRLQSDGSFCALPSDIFPVGDLDEDGCTEIGQYFSACTGHYKSLHVYTLKGDTWKEIGQCVYDLYYADQQKPYQEYIKKTGKGKFSMLEITDLVGEESSAGKPRWLAFSM